MRITGAYTGSTSLAQGRSRSGTGFSGPLGLLAYALFAFRVRRERRELLGLDDSILKDLGLSRSLIDHEARRSLLDLPDQNPIDRRRSF